jgi:hypothetical protein
VLFGIRGRSRVVDYGVASQCLIPDIKFFTVHGFLADLSDHCQISLLLKTEKVDEILFFFLLDYWANWIQALLK